MGHPTESTLPQMPRDPRLDSSLALLADPYGYIGKQCVELGTDLFEARLLLKRTICMTGPQAAELFYDGDRFQRAGAAPEPLRATLFGNAGVQTLDGPAHRHRKALFMSMMTGDSIAALTRRCNEEWRLAALAWERQARVTLYDALHEPLTKAVCDWAGVPLPETDVRQRTRDLVALFDRAAAKGMGHLRARAARQRSEAWAGGLVDAVRDGRLRPPERSALDLVASHRDADGRLLPTPVAAVELLNVLRPTVAVSVFIVFLAHALHLHPECRLAMLQREPGYATCLVQEVRRHYPFFPAVVALAKHDFEWRGYRLPAGRRVMLDLYGINHDPRAWREPLAFEPGRFREREPGPFEFVPQGGAEPHRQHRCPGEAIAVELMKAAAEFLTLAISYDVPAQDLMLDMARLPALPKAGFVMSGVRVLG